MRSIVKQSNKKAGFTIVELLTVMSIIVILFSLLVPALNMVRRYAKRVKQNAQFHSINAALQLFNNEFEGYPDSDALDEVGNLYPGAMKLAEALVGQDLLGFHPDSLFRADGINPAFTPPLDDLYRTLNLVTTNPDDVENFRARQGPYLPVDAANVYTLWELYGGLPNGFGTLGDPADPNGGIVLCDEYPRTRNAVTGKRIGMPVLYYKANVSKTRHDLTTPTQNTYNHLDNLDLINLGLPWDTADIYEHAMASVAGTTPDDVATNAGIFYVDTRNEKITTIPRPKRPESYILISAGFDGLYGTNDDIFNFGN